VRVTPANASGAVGEPLRATTSHPIALPENVVSSLHDWVDLGQKSFVNVTEGDKERQILFTHEKLKLRDKGGKHTIAKSDGYAGVQVKLDFVHSALAFTLIIPSKRSTSPPQSFALSAPAGVRDLIALTLLVFTDVAQLERLPKAPTTSSSLHLSAVGSHLISSKPEGGGASPASSMTSEQQSIADVEDARAPPSEGGASASGKARVSASGLAKIAATGRKLSFTRAAKKGK